MEQAFLSYCKANKLIADGRKVLIAISGGADSVVLAHLFSRCTIPFGLAHCNFHLRGEHSNGDEQFVRALSDELKCPLFVAEFDTTTFATENKLSIEMAARQLRYEWFETIRSQNAYAFIATAHHQEDNAETILLNLVRGTGLKGLLGIKNKLETIIRPLLFADKAMILEYVHRNSLKYRTDESNFENIYKRNKLRNQVFPLLKELNPSVIQTFNKNANRLAQSNALLEKAVKQELLKLIVAESEIQKVSISQLQKTEAVDVLLYEWLHPFGFSETAIQNIAETFDAQSGKQFNGNGYQLVKDRDMLILSLQTTEFEDILLNETDTVISGLVSMQMSQCLPVDVDYKHATANQAFLDTEKLLFPLRIRRWQAGDSFIPLGMKNRKKVSDFLIDAKISIAEKQKVLVLENGDGEIVWLIGYRVGDGFKIVNKTNKVLFLRIA